MDNVYSKNDIEKLNVAEKIKKQSESLGISYCTIEDKNYPNALKELPDRPVVLYYRGEIGILNTYKNIAVIGSRNCSLKGKELSYKTGRILAGEGMTVVNGMAQKIVDAGGCILSEYPVGTSLNRYQYVERDRLQSGISQGVLVIEAERTSGTMHTADFAVRQYKRLACYYHKLVEMSSGNQYLEESGRAVNVKNEDDVLAFARELPQTGGYQQMSLF